MHTRILITFLTILFQFFSLWHLKTPLSFFLYCMLRILILSFIKWEITSSAITFIIIINNIGTRLSPYLTPYLYSITNSSFPIFSTIWKLLYSFSTYFLNLLGAPIFSNTVKITSCLILSYIFTRSMNDTNISLLYSLLV